MDVKSKSEEQLPKACYRSFLGHTTAHAVVVGLGRTAQAPIAWPRGLGLRYLGLDWTGLGGVLVQELILVLGLTLVLALILLLVLILILILAFACESSKDTQRM